MLTLPLWDVQPVAVDCTETCPSHSLHLTQISSIIKPLQSALCGCTVTILITKWQRDVLQKTNVNNLGTLSWIIWLISLLNRCKWPLFLLWTKQTWLVCAGQQNKEMLELTAPLIVLPLLLAVTSRIRGLSFGISREPWGKRGERKVGLNSKCNSSSFLFPLSLLTETKAEVTDGFLQLKVFCFIHSCHYKSNEPPRGETVRTGLSSHFLH